MKTILIVDDEQELVDTMVRALSRHPQEFSILTASNGAEAISILEREPVDLITTDLNMPVMNGFHLLVYILKNCPAIPVLVITAYDISNMRERISQRGFRSITYLQKPFSLKFFLATVREHLNNTAKNAIQGISLFSILQLLQLELKTCALRIYSAAGEGNLSFIDGELVHAWSNDLVGPEAVYEVMGWSDSRIELRDLPAGTHRTINVSLSHILMESVRLQDERDGRSAVPPAPAADELPDEQELALAAGDPQGPAADAATLDDAHLFNEPTLESFSVSGKELDMSNVKQSLDEAMNIDGAIGIALADYKSGMALGTAGGNGSFNLEIAAAGNTEVIRSKMKVMSNLGLNEAIEDILITLGNQYHLIRLLKSSPGLFLYLALSKSQANLAMARHKLAQIESNLSV
ncbi:MAG TPA: response regulator [Herpetosiphonaceae bacterium]